MADAGQAQVDPELEIFARALNGLAEAREAVRQADAVIRRYNKLLDHIQPSSPGKIGIRFIKPWGGAQTQPTFVVWHRAGEAKNDGKLIHYTVHKPEGITKQIKRYGPFAGTQEDVRFLVTRIQRLVTRRKALVGMVGRFLQSRAVTVEALRKAEQDVRDDLLQELSALQQRHFQRVKAWEAKKKARADEVSASENEDGPGVLPDTYVDEDGNYVGP